MYAVAIFLLYMKCALSRNIPAFLQGEGSRPCLRRRGQGFQPPPLPSLSWKTQVSQLCFSSPSVLTFYRSQYLFSKGYEVTLSSENTTEKVWAFSSVSKVFRVLLHGLCSYAPLSLGRICLFPKEICDITRNLKKYIKTNILICLCVCFN